MKNSKSHDSSQPQGSHASAGMAALVAGAVGVYYLLTEHLTHVTQAIPYLFLLACPLMHLFHGHGHGHGHHHQGSRDSESSTGLPPKA